MGNKVGILWVTMATPRVKVADVDWNISEIIDICHNITARENPSIIVFPELAVTGYTCGDLFLQKVLIEAAERGIKRLCEATAGLSQTIVVGCPVARDGALYDAALVIREGKVIGMVPKTDLTPEETRWFKSASSPQLFNTGEVTFRVQVGDNPSSADGADVVICPVASFELAGKHLRRKARLCVLSEENHAAYVYSCNGYGESTDDFVWAGSSLICAYGKVVAEKTRFQTVSSWITAAIDLSRLGETSGQSFKGWFPNLQSRDPYCPADINLLSGFCREVFNLQATALMSRLEHIHCNKCVIGVSGGLDSTLALLVTCEAFDRLGYDRKGIYGVTMPCFGTSSRTKSNAWVLMDRLGITAMEVNIGDAVLQHFKDIGHDPSVHDVTFENSQARERTQVLMDLGNKVGGIVVGTGDLSEIALGWCTYNGDHMSMYGVNSGVPKTLIRAIVRLLAYGHPCEGALLDILDTPVSPELLPGAQPTEGIIGPYDLHDFFLWHVTRGENPRDILALASVAFSGTYDEDTIRKWLSIFLKRFFSQQFKRACSPCGPKVLDVSLSPRGDWMMPTDASSRLWLEDASAGI